MKYPTHCIGFCIIGFGAEVFRLSVLFIEGDEWWSAQCLEYDIAAQAKTMNDLFYEMERVLVSQIALDEELGRKPFEGIAPAPEQYRFPPAAGD